ncbi:MAG: hypothetical protein ACI89U_001650 [Gammaproteobacteria bacterium]|jgi:hypothetical protein
MKKFVFKCYSYENTPLCSRNLVMRTISFISLLILLTISSNLMSAPNDKSTNSGKKSDTEPPTIVVPKDITAEALSSAGRVITFDISATDNRRKGLTTNCTPASGSVFPIAQTTVQCIARDKAGNETSDNFIINIIDSTKPILSLPSNVIKNTTYDSGERVIFAANASDNIDGTVEAICSPTSGSQFSVGQTTVSCTASDSNGNEASGVFGVTLTLVKVDTTAPVLSLPTNLTAEAVSSNGAPVMFSFSALDEVDGVVAVNCSHDSGSIFPLTTTTVSCATTDAAGNTSSGNFAVSVIDSLPPKLLLPADISTDSEFANGDIVIYTVSASDTVDGDVSVNCSANSGSSFPIGQTIVLCDSVDNRGNAAKGSFNVTVKKVEAPDTIAPVLSLPANITAEASSPNGAIITFIVSALDEVDGAVTVNCSQNSGETFSLKTTIVSCNAMDSWGNTSNGSFTVSVIDTISPQLLLPADIYTETESTGGAAISFSVSANDSVDNAVTVNCSATSGSIFAMGQTTVSCDAVDKSGNTAAGSFNITIAQTTVVDTVAPLLSLPNSAATQAEEATAASGASVHYIASAVDEIEGSVPLNCSATSGSTFAIGQTSVTCSASDSQGNTASGSFSVFVIDSAAPQLTLPADLTLDAADSTGIVVNYLASATDTVDPLVDITCTPMTGSLFAVGDSPVNCEATDSSGNVASGEFLVTVFSTPVTTSSSVNLTWSIPTSRENGDPLAVGELASYEIYVVAENSGGDQVLIVNDPLTTSTTITDLQNDTYHFAISAIDANGLRSSLSELVSIVLP